MEEISKKRMHLLEAQHDLQKKQRLDDNKHNLYMYLNSQQNELRSVRTALQKLQNEEGYDSDTSEANEMKETIGDLKKEVAAS
jgi:DNA repair ATPase RecN